jgi:hypothetical protein
MPFVLACFQENPDSDEKDALFRLDTQITTQGGKINILINK